MLPQFFKRYKYYLIVSFLFGVLFFPYQSWAGTVAPTTTHEYSGTLGNNGWYISTVEITLRASDMESGPKSTTFWLNSQAPTTVEYGTIQNQILNPSFEDSDRNGLWPFYWYSVRHWNDNDCEPCNALFWQSRRPGLGAPIRGNVLRRLSVPLSGLSRSTRRLNVPLSG